MAPVNVPTPQQATPKPRKGGVKVARPTVPRVGKRK
jgi:hypothetical protein